MMRRLVIIVATIAAVAHCFAAHEVECVEYTHDFGAISEEAGSVSCELKFINRGDKSIAVAGASASCGCTTPSYSRQSVAPGDTGVVSVTFDPQGRPGRFAKKVKVTTVDGQGETVASSLMIKGVVVGASATIRSRYPVEAGPLRLRNTTIPFGQVKKNRQASAFLEAYNPTADTIRPTFGEAGNGFVPRLVEGVIPPGQQGTIAVVFSSDRNPLYGIVTDSIQFYATAESEPLMLDVVAIVEEDFSRLSPQARAKAPQAKLDPYTLDLGVIDASTGPIKGAFKIVNRGDSPMLIRRIYTTDAGVTVIQSPEKIKKNKSGEVTIEVDPSQFPSELIIARLQIITNDPAQPTHTLRIVGQKKQ
ncbi:MAG: DUF1573 domain-containing protein [Muribaculaceae bacterium]|nr:DUF1573 domain-containing protein [Muribaculaceae bacterium]